MLSVVIPTKDKRSRLRLCLEEVLTELRGMSSAEIVVVDDGSCDGTDRLLADACVERLRVVHHPEPVGRAGARNAGARAASGEILLFLDDDVIVEPGLLAAHLGAHLAAEVPLLLRSRIVNLPWMRHLADPLTADPGDPPRLHDRVAALKAAPRRAAALSGLGRRMPFEAALQALLSQPPPHWPAATGGCLSMTRSVFDALGGFEAAFGRHWGLEDLELGLRAEALGVRISQADPAIFHLDHPTPDRDPTQSHGFALFEARHGRERADWLRSLMGLPAPREPDLVAP